jgi:aryl-alcohol dehydrogenase-like predicted oxidoreductase
MTKDNYKFQNTVQPEFILGTANLEQHYGKKGQSSFLPRTEAESIVRDIVSRNQGAIETSSAYGNAEKILGEILSGTEFERIITKIVPEEYSDSKRIIESVSKSLKNLGQNRIQTVMLHGGLHEAIKHQDVLQEAFETLLSRGMVQNIGYSAYEEQEVIKINQIFPIINQFQMPENIADKRCLNSGPLSNLALIGNEFQFRSIFLQGKLFLSNLEAQRNFPEIIPVLNFLDDTARLLNCQRLDICIAYAKSVPWASKLVFGVRTFEDYSAITKSLNYSHLRIENFGPCLEPTLIDPRNWK